MSNCSLCGAQNLEWLENVHKLVNPISKQEHGPGLCMIKIPRYKVDNGVSYPRKDEWIAYEITKAAVQLHCNPYKVRIDKAEDHLILRA